MLVNNVFTTTKNELTSSTNPEGHWEDGNPCIPVVHDVKAICLYEALVSESAC